MNRQNTSPKLKGSADTDLSRCGGFSFTDMAKKSTNPWIYTSAQIPRQGEKVLIDYVTAEKKSFLSVGHFDGQTGWWIHGTMQLPSGWRVYSWMPIPPNEPF